MLFLHAVEEKVGEVRGGRPTIESLTVRGLQGTLPPEADGSLCN